MNFTHFFYLKINFEFGKSLNVFLGESGKEHRFDFVLCTTDMQECPLPCESLPIVIGGATFSRKLNLKKTGRLYLYILPQVAKTEEHYLYTFLSLFAEIGGYVGILWGCSILNLADVLTTLFQPCRRNTAQNTQTKY